MRQRLHYGFLCLAAALLLCACGRQPATKADARDWPRHIDALQEAWFTANPAYAVTLGRHDFDGRLPDWSEAGLQGEIARLKQAQTATAAFTDQQLNPAQRFERDYVLAVIDGTLFWMEQARWPWRNPSYYLGTNALDPSTYLSRPYAKPAQRLKAFIAYLKAVPKATAQIKANLRAPLPRSYLKLGINGFGGFPEFYRKDAVQAFAEVKDEALQAELKAAVEPAAQAMQALADALKAQEPKANDDYALGAKNFADMLWRTERVDTPLPQLEAIARAELARDTQALQQACEQWMPGQPVADCIAAEASHKPEGGSVEAARAQLSELERFVRYQELASIPGDEAALVAEAPPYQRWNFAYIDIAGPYDRGMPSTYYIAPPDPSWPKAEQEAYTPGRANLLFTSAHEVWPGHFLQFLHSNRGTFPFGRNFVGYAYAEGWGLYAEELMWEAGYGRGDPEIHVGQLLNALLRDVRFVCAIGLHTKGMSVQQCETLFREQAWQDPGNARQQAARGTYDPAYLNYTLGKLMIRKLRADWTPSRGRRAAWREFHDKFLSHGGPPIPLLRERMMGAKGELFDAPVP